MKNTKKDRIKFVSEIQKIILNHGGKIVPSLNSQGAEYEIPLGDEPLKITLYNSDHQEDLYSVYMKHKKFYGISHPNHKNNFHSCEKNVDEVIKSFEVFLNDAMSMSMQLGEYVKVITHSGTKLCFIDMINSKRVHFKNQKFGLEVNAGLIQSLPKTWRGAKYIYHSFN